MAQRGQKKGYTPSAAQLAQREKFKAMVAAKRKPAAAAPAAAPAAAKEDYTAVYVILGLLLAGGIAYWYFTKDKKPGG